jgi:prepilin-type N-terminal cleavage/methylation domain-containing protein
MTFQFSKHTQQQGFTLIESLITVSVMGILAAITAPSFATWIDNKKVEDIAAQVEGAMKEAQLEAVKKSQSCTVTVATTITSNPTNCLPTGTRDLTKLGLSVLSKNDSGITLFAGLGTTPDILFTYKGTVPTTGTGSVPGTGLIIIYNNNGGSSRKMRCITVSAGLGIIRSGYYSGSTSVPVSSSCNTNLS